MKSDDPIIQRSAIRFEPFMFMGLQKPLGFLSPARESHALWYYYTLARLTYENVIVDPIVYECEDDPVANFRQLFVAISETYGVNPDGMAKAWPEVDMQCLALQLPKLPDEERYRFDRPCIILNDKSLDS